MARRMLAIEINEKALDILDYILHYILPQSVTITSGIPMYRSRSAHWLPK